MRERDFGDSSRQTLAKIVLSLLALVTGCGIVLAARSARSKAWKLTLNP